MLLPPDMGWPAVKPLKESHFCLYRIPSGISVMPLTAFGGCWLSEITGKDWNVTVTPEAAMNLMLEFYVCESSPTLD